MLREMSIKLTAALNASGYSATYNESFGGIEVDGVGFECVEFGDGLSIQNSLGQGASIHFHNGEVDVKYAKEFLSWAIGNVQRARRWKNGEGAEVEKLAAAMCDEVRGVSVFVSPNGDGMSISLPLHSITGPEGALRILEAVRKEIIQ
ncbi:hypothetical protein [Sorangium sp. So ce388]|uniref:hypothetical protein n=1 Tax=Sorangium sp. So ce388 TaxID=3133309 RepID=UPI003F5B5C21